MKSSARRPRVKGNSEYVRGRIFQVQELEKKIKYLEGQLREERDIRTYPCKHCRRLILASHENILKAFGDWGHITCP